MAYSANLDQMLDALRHLSAPEADSFRRILEATGTEMARIIARMAGCGASDADSQEAGVGGTLARFWPLAEGAPIPDCLDGADDASEWQFDAPDACSCDDCSWAGTVDELQPIKHLHQRVAPGEPMPDGECPSCGALVHADGEA